MQCPRCHVSQLVEISLQLQGEPIRMRSCSRCDTRWWETEGASLDLTDVL
jgi:transcriptional regulator NrdR family protein